MEEENRKRKREEGFSQDTKRVRKGNKQIGEEEEREEEEREDKEEEREDEEEDSVLVH